jgi:hypothetical protein
MPFNGSKMAAIYEMDDIPLPPRRLTASNTTPKSPPPPPPSSSRSDRRKGLVLFVDELPSQIKDLQYDGPRPPPSASLSAPPKGLLIDRKDLPRLVKKVVRFAPDTKPAWMNKSSKSSVSFSFKVPISVLIYLPNRSPLSLFSQTIPGKFLVSLLCTSMINLQFLNSSNLNHIQSSSNWRYHSHTPFSLFIKLSMYYHLSTPCA